MVADPSNAAHTFAKKLEERMKTQFKYLLDPKAKDFQAIFWVATYLSPVTCLPCHLCRTPGYFGGHSHRV